MSVSGQCQCQYPVEWFVASEELRTPNSKSRARNSVLPGERRTIMLRKIISGGQTGADRAGLDFAIEAGLEHGGSVPRGRIAEDGRIDDRYNLIELSTGSYPARTR